MHKLWIKLRGSLSRDEIIVYLTAFTIFINVFINAAIAVVVAFYSLINKNMRRRIFDVAYSRWMLAFCVLLIIVPPFFHNWLGWAASGLLACLLVFSLYLRVVMHKAMFHRAIDLMSAASFLGVVVAIIQKLTTQSRISSTFVSASYYGYAIELLLILAVYRLFTLESKKVKTYYAVMIAFNLIGLYLSCCRAAWVSVAAGLIIYLIMEKKTKILWLLFAFCTAGVGLILLFPDSAFRINEFAKSGGDHLIIWRMAVKSIIQYPAFGQGMLALYHTSGQFYHAHNLLLEFLLTSGVIGSCLFMVYFCGTIKNCIPRYRTNTDKKIFSLFIAATVATILHGLIDVTVMWSQTGILYGIIFSTTSLMLRTEAKVIEMPLPLQGALPDQELDDKVSSIQ